MVWNCQEDLSFSSGRLCTLHLHQVTSYDITSRCQAHSGPNRAVKRRFIRCLVGLLQIFPSSPLSRIPSSQQNDFSSASTLIAVSISLNFTLYLKSNASLVPETTMTWSYPNHAVSHLLGKALSCTSLVKFKRCVTPRAHHNSKIAAAQEALATELQQINLEKSQAQVLFFSYVFGDWMLLKLEDKCHLWIRDFSDCCEWEGEAIHRLVINVSASAHSSGRKTLIAFLQSWPAWNVSCDTFCFPLLSHKASAPWLFPHPCPEAPTHMIQLTRGENRAVCGYLHQQALVNSSADPLLSSRQELSTLELRYIFILTNHTLQSRAGVTWRINDLVAILYCLLPTDTSKKGKNIFPSLALTDNPVRLCWKLTLASCSRGTAAVEFSFN